MREGCSPDFLVSDSDFSRLSRHNGASPDVKLDHQASRQHQPLFSIVRQRTDAWNARDRRAHSLTLPRILHDAPVVIHVATLQPAAGRHLRPLHPQLAHGGTRVRSMGCDRARHALRRGQWKNNLLGSRRLVCVCESTLFIRRHRSFERLLFCIEQAWWHYEVILGWMEVNATAFWHAGKVLHAAEAKRSTVNP